MPTTAAIAIKIIGCNFFTFGTRFVIVKITTPKATAFQLIKVIKFHIDRYRWGLNNAISPTEQQAAAINAVEAGRSP